MRDKLIMSKKELRRKSIFDLVKLKHTHKRLDHITTSSTIWCYFLSKKGYFNICLTLNTHKLTK